MIGFEHGPYEPVEFERETRRQRHRRHDRPGRPRPPRRPSPAVRRQLFERLAASPGRKVVTCVPAPGHEHDITVALPGLAADPLVLATVVVATYTPGRPTVPQALPEGFDARITFDPARARARRSPAIDPDRTSARTYPDVRHEHIAGAARDALAGYAIIDPVFVLPDPSTFDDPAAAERAPGARALPDHTFRPFEQFSALPAADTPMAEVLDTVEDPTRPLRFQSFTGGRGTRCSCNNVVVARRDFPSSPHKLAVPTATHPRLTERQTEPGSQLCAAGWYEAASSYHLSTPLWGLGE